MAAGFGVRLGLVAEGSLDGTDSATDVVVRFNRVALLPNNFFGCCKSGFVFLPECEEAEDASTVEIDDNLIASS